jgi:hypothetical protein
MRDDEIDLTLARNDDIVPSSGFTASVIDAITRESTAPPPIPFPWKRAVPGMAWCLLVTIGFLMMGPKPRYTPPPASGALNLSPVLGGAVWVCAAIVVSLLSVALSARLTRRI